MNIPHQSQKLKLYNGKTLPGYNEDNVKELRKDKVETKANAKIKHTEEKKDYVKRLRGQRNNSIKSQSKLKKEINDRGGEINFLKGSIVEQEEEIYDMQGKIGRLNTEKKQILSVMDELKVELEEKNRKEREAREAALRAEMQKDEVDELDEEETKVDDELIDEEQKESFYVSIGYLIFILVIVVVFYNMNHSSESYDE